MSRRKSDRSTPKLSDCDVAMNEAPAHQSRKRQQPTSTGTGGKKKSGVQGESGRPSALGESGRPRVKGKEVVGKTRPEARQGSPVQQEDGCEEGMEAQAHGPEPLQGNTVCRMCGAASYYKCMESHLLCTHAIERGSEDYRWAMSSPQAVSMPKNSTLLTEFRNWLLSMKGREQAKKRRLAPERQSQVGMLWSELGTRQFNLTDITAENLEAWTEAQRSEGLRGPEVIESHIMAMKHFLDFLKKTDKPIVACYDWCFENLTCAVQRRATEHRNEFQDKLISSEPKLAFKETRYFLEIIAPLIRSGDCCKDAKQFTACRDALLALCLTSSSLLLPVVLEITHSAVLQAGETKKGGKTVRHITLSRPWTFFSKEKASIALSEEHYKLVGMFARQSITKLKRKPEDLLFSTWAGQPLTPGSGHRFISKVFKACENHNINVTDRGPPVGLGLDLRLARAESMRASLYSHVRMVATLQQFEAIQAISDLGQRAEKVFGLLPDKVWTQSPAKELDNATRHVFPKLLGISGKEFFVKAYQLMDKTGCDLAARCMREMYEEDCVTPKRDTAYHVVARLFNQVVEHEFHLVMFEALTYMIPSLAYASYLTETHRPITYIMAIAVLASHFKADPDALDQPVEPAVPVLSVGQERMRQRVSWSGSRRKPSVRL